MQLMEARTELDTLEQILSSPLVVPNMPRWAPFFKATPRLLGSDTTVEAMQQELVVLLFPGLGHLNVAACLLSKPPANER